MQVGTGKSILNGIAIGKLKLYKKKDVVISAADVADPAAEEARFEDARAKAIDQQTALYEKALDEAGEDIAEVSFFNVLIPYTSKIFLGCLLIFLCISDISAQNLRLVR